MNQVMIPAFAALLAFSPSVLADGKACELTSAEELQGAIKAKPALKPSVLPSGVEVCTGKAGVSTIVIRAYQKKDDAEQDKEAARLESLQKAGATVETRRIGSTNCVEIRPGGKAARQPYATSCTTGSSSRKPMFVVVEVSSPSQSLVDVRQLASLAESMAGRMY